jgi:hypothetical protein
MMISESYPDQISGTLSCYDRKILQGTLPGWCYDQGTTDFFDQGFCFKLKIFLWFDSNLQLVELRVRPNRV